MSKSKMNVTSKIVAYSDIENTHPLKKIVDWQTDVSGVLFELVDSKKMILQPGIEQTITTSHGTTYVITPNPQCSISPHPRRVGEYIVRYISGGVGAYDYLSFLSLGGIAVGGTVTVTPNNDGTIKLTGIDTLVPKGSWVWLSGALFGQVGPFSDSNSGLWEVVSNLTSGVSMSFILKRVYSTDPEGESQTFTSTDPQDVQQLTDSVASNTNKIRYAFIENYHDHGLFPITEFASGFYVIKTNRPLNESDATYFDNHYLTSQFYGYMRIETDQPLLLKTSEIYIDPLDGNNRFEQIEQFGHIIVPFELTNGKPGWIELFGFSPGGLNIKNVGQDVANVQLITGIPEGYSHE